MDDAGAAKLFESLTRLQVGSRRIMLAGNGITDAAISALSSYLWHSPEPLWELNLSDNRVSSRGIEELLRCLYNHPSHPPRLPSAQSAAGGPGFALRLDLRGNGIEDIEAMMGRVESQGGANSVKLAAIAGDGPAPPPAADPNQQLPFLWVFLPRIAEQHRGVPEDRLERKDRADRREKREKKEKSDRKDKVEKKERGEKKEKKVERHERKDREAQPPEPPQQVRPASAEKDAGRGRKEERARRAKSAERRRPKNGRRRRSGSGSGSGGGGGGSRSCSRSRSRGASKARKEPEGGAAKGPKGGGGESAARSPSGSPQQRRSRRRRG